MQRNYQFKAANPEQIQTIRVMLKKRGFGNFGKYLDNSSNEGQLLFDKGINLGAMVWYAIPESEKKEGSLSKEQFINVVWAFLTTQPNSAIINILSQAHQENINSTLINNYHYLRGLTQEHLVRLFEIYTEHSQNKLMSLIDFIHVFTYLPRINIPYEKEEISLAQWIDLIHASATILASKTSHPLCISRAEVEKQLKQKAEAKDQNQYVIYLSEGRAGVYMQRRETVPANLVLACYGADGKIGHIPLVCVRTQNHPAINLKFLPGMVKDLKSISVASPFLQRFLQKLSLEAPSENKTEPLTPLEAPKESVNLEQPTQQPSESDASADNQGVGEKFNFWNMDSSMILLARLAIKDNVKDSAIMDMKLTSYLIAEMVGGYEASYLASLVQLAKTQEIFTKGYFADFPAIDVGFPMSMSQPMGIPLTPVSPQFELPSNEPQVLRRPPPLPFLLTNQFAGSSFNFNVALDRQKDVKDQLPAQVATVPVEPRPTVDFSKLFSGINFNINSGVSVDNKAQPLPTELQRPLPFFNFFKPTESKLEQLKKFLRELSEMKVGGGAPDQETVISKSKIESILQLMFVTNQDMEDAKKSVCAILTNRIKEAVTAKEINFNGLTMGSHEWKQAQDEERIAIRRTRLIEFMLGIQNIQKDTVYTVPQLEKAIQDFNARKASQSPQQDVGTSYQL